MLSSPERNSDRSRNPKPSFRNYVKETILRNLYNTCRFYLNPQKEVKFYLNPQKEVKNGPKPLKGYYSAYFGGPGRRLGKTPSQNPSKRPCRHLQGHMWHKQGRREAEAEELPKMKVPLSSLQRQASETFFGVTGTVLRVFWVDLIAEDS